MHPARRRALEWCRDNGNRLGIPDADEPSLAMLRRLEDQDMITLSAGRFDGARWKLTEHGRRVLEIPK